MRTKLILLDLTGTNFSQERLQVIVNTINARGIWKHASPTDKIIKISWDLVKIRNRIVFLNLVEKRVLSRVCKTNGTHAKTQKIV